LSTDQDPVKLSLHQSLTQTVIVSETPNKHFKTIMYRGGLQGSDANTHRNAAEEATLADVYN